MGGETLLDVGCGEGLIGFGALEPRRPLGWTPDFDVAAVQLRSGTWTSPPAEAQKRFVNVKEDDLVSYYEALRTQA